MPDATAETFNCPHCGKVFPILPSLVGRSVRCNKCREPFKLTASGVAEKVTSDEQVKTLSSGTPPEKPRSLRTTEAAEPAPAADSSASVTSEEQVARVKAQMAAASRMASESVASKAGTTGQGIVSSDLDDTLRDVTRTWMDQADARQEAGRTRRHKEIPATRRMTKRIDAVRASMSATLSTAAEAAAKTVSGDHGTALEPGRQIEVKLSGEGLVEARRGRQWLLGLLSAVIVCAVLFWLAAGERTHDAILAAYAAPPQAPEGEQRLSVEQRLAAIRDRCWLWSVDGDRRPMLLVDPGTTEIGPQRRVELLGLDRLVASSEMEPVPELAAFVLRGEGAALRRLARIEQAPATLTDLYALAKDNDLTCLPYADVGETLADLVLNDEAVWALAALLVGTTDDRGGNRHRDRLLHGDIPTALETMIVRGSDATRLHPQGSVVVVAEPVNAYRVLLVRLSGTDWDDDWRVLDCHMESGDLRLPDPLSGAIRQAELAYADLRATIAEQRDLANGTADDAGADGEVRLDPFGNPIVPGQTPVPPPPP